MERVLLIVKPDGMEEQVLPHVMQGLILAPNFDILESELKVIEEEPLRGHYAHVADKSFFEPMVAEIAGQELLVAMLRGDNAIEIGRRVLGATVPAKADPDTLRGRFGYKGTLPNGLLHNVAHWSDSVKNGVIEPARFFDLSDDDLVGLFAEDLQYSFGASTASLTRFTTEVYGLIQVKKEGFEDSTLTVNSILSDLIEDLELGNPDDQRFVRELVEGTIEAALL